MRPGSIKSAWLWSVLVVAAVMLGAVLYLRVRKEGGVTVTVGAANADVIGTDNMAIQKAVDRVAAAGGGTVLIKAGTYTLANAVRLKSHITLRGEGPAKTILQKAAGVESKLKIDADYGEFKATVEDARGFKPGMGVTIVDSKQRSGWTPSVRTVLRVAGDTLYFDRFLHMDYHVANDGEVFNTFPLVAGYDVHDVKVEDLTVDGSRDGSGILDGCQAGGIYFFHSTQMAIRECVARNYPGDGISCQFVEDPAVEKCDSYDNAFLGIHLGTGALRGLVLNNRVHNNGEDGLYLCWRVQHARYEGNQSWDNGRDGISMGHKDSDNLFVKNVVRGNARAGIFVRDEDKSNAADGNTFESNTIEDNGRPGSPGEGIHIAGATEHLTFVNNVIRATDAGAKSVQAVGVYVGPNTDFITFQHNVITGGMKEALVNKSNGGNNHLVLGQQIEARLQGKTP
jgi:parallel beta-helix repeat protein